MMNSSFPMLTRQTARGEAKGKRRNAVHGLQTHNEPPIGQLSRSGATSSAQAKLGDAVGLPEDL